MGLLNKRSFLMLVFFFLLAFTVTVQAVIQESSLKVFAVTTEGEGISADLMLRVASGSGKIYSSVEPLVGTTTQSAEKTAVELAKSYSKEVDSFDYLFEIKSNAAVVEGPSAGSAMALLVIASLQDKAIPENIALTGTVSENGSIGQVGGVFEKAKAASEAGIKLFLIPKGESKQVVKLPEGVKNINLPDFALQNWGLKVVEVANIDEALQLAFSRIEEIDVNKTSAEALELVFVPTPMFPSLSLQPIQGFTKQYLDQLGELIQNSRTSLSTTLIDDAELINALLESLGEAEDNLKEAELLFDSNYLYSASNLVFLTKVNASVIKEISDNPSILEKNSAVFKLKVSELSEKIKELKAELDFGMPVDSIEWYVAARQRLAWSELQVQELSKQQEITIIVNDEPVEEALQQIERIQNLEFAKAWFDVAVFFYSVGKNSEKHVVLDNAFEKTLDELIVEVENGLTIVKGDDIEDILRRYNAARLAKSNSSFLSGSFDAASALSLIQARIDIQDKSFEQLESVLEEKVSSLSRRIKDSNYSIVWANLYLDHARYFLEGARFYYSNNQGSKAASMLKNGISVAFLAEVNFEIAQEAYKVYANASPDSFLESKKGGIGATIKIEKEFPPEYYVLLAVLSALVVLAIALLIVIALTFVTQNSSNSFSREVKRIEAKQKILEEKLAKGKISKEEFLAKSQELSSQFHYLHALQQLRSGKTIRADRIKAQLFALELELKELKTHFKQGLILKKDFEQTVSEVSKGIESFKAQLALQPKKPAKAGIAKAKKPSQTLEKMWKQTSKARGREKERQRKTL